MGHLAHAFRALSDAEFDSIGGMDSDRIEPRPHRSLEVNDREALALLAALELSPFEDEILEQKLLNLVYSPDSHSFRRRPRYTRQTRHLHRRQVG